MEAVSLCSKGVCLSIHGDGLRCNSNRELNVDRVRLLWNQLEIVDDFLLETILFHFQPEGCGGQRIEVVHPGVIADPDLLFAGGGIGQREVGAGNDCACGVGYRALNGGSILGVRQRCEKDDAGKSKTSAKCRRSGAAHGGLPSGLETSIRGTTFTKRLEKRFSSSQGSCSTGDFPQSSALC